MTVPTLTIGGKGLVGDLTGGSWSVSESATPVDVLDTNGSLPQVGAAFGYKSQGVTNTPGTTPAASSSYLHGQKCTFTHSSLGSINGSILTVNPQSSTVKIEMSTPLTALNFNATMPAFVDGQVFYSWTPKLQDGSSFYWIRGMTCDTSGNIWITGDFGSNGFTCKYDRFGNLLLQISHSYQGVSVQLDSSGNLYVQYSTGVDKYNASTGAFVSTIITATNPTVFVLMAIDRSNNIWLATTDSAANAAIKKYSTAGTLGGASGTYSPGSASSNGVFNQYVGMSISPTGASTDDVLVFNYAYGPTPTQFGLWAQRMTGTTQVSQFQAGNGAYNTEIPASIGADGYWNGTAGVTRAVTGTGIWASPGNVNTSGNTWADWISQTPKASSAISPLTLSQFIGASMAMDRNGFGYYIGSVSTVYVVAGGNLSTNQCIERYLGYAGYNGSISYGTNTPYAAVTDTTRVYPSWSGNVWSNLKELCAVTQRLISTNGTGIYIRRCDNRSDLYKFNINNRYAPPQITQAQPGAQVINVTSQNVTGGTSVTDAYIADPTSSPIVVDVSGVSVTTVQANFHATNIIQPTASDIAVIYPNVSGGYSGNMSIYGIVDSSNPPLRVPAATWLANGGGVTVAPSATVGSIDITVYGPAAIAGFTGPFAVGYLSGSQKLGGLVLRGWGCSINPSTFPVYTGAPISLVQQLTSSNMNSTFLNSMSVAYDAARMSAAVLGGGEMTLQVDIPISDITVGFGSAIGGYFFWHRNYWRVTDITYSGGKASLTAVRDTRQFDVQDGTITHGTIDTTWSGFRYQDNYLSPGIIGE